MSEETLNQEKETTTVKVAVTNVKYFSNAENTLQEIELLGRWRVVECRAYIRNLDKLNIYITKETTTDSFEVNTVELYQLKQENQ